MVTSESPQVPVAEGLFTWNADRPRLLGSRCTECENHMFPVQAGCSKCGGASTAIVELATRGTLWTWTVQSYPPKAPPFAGNVDPETFEPYGVGYVNLDDKLLVESRLTIADPDQLAIGMELDLVIEPLYINANGEQVVTFAFAPATTDPESSQS